MELKLNLYSEIKILDNNNKVVSVIFINNDNYCIKIEKKEYILGNGFLLFACFDSNNNYFVYGDKAIISDISTGEEKIISLEDFK